MKKQTLERLLINTEPDGGETDLDSPDKILKFYLDGNSIRISLEREAKNIPAKINYWSSGWDSIQLMLGVIYRIQADGYKIMQMIGLSEEEVLEFNRIAMVIRIKSKEYNNRSEQTLTKKLHDHIRQIGF